MNNSQAAGGGIGIFTALFLIFLTLKLCGVIDWSWWFVTAPLWGPPVVLIGLVVGAVFVILLFYIFLNIRKMRQQKRG
jgi:hypothetical protein